MFKKKLTLYQAVERFETRNQVPMLSHALSTRNKQRQLGLVSPDSVETSLTRAVRDNAKFVSIHFQGLVSPSQAVERFETSS